MMWKGTVLKIIEGGLEMDESKVRAYVGILMTHCEDKRLYDALKRRLDGTYKDQPKVKIPEFGFKEGEEKHE